jgi:hypothetical protein
VLLSVKIPTTGVVMTLPKKCDVRKGPSASRNMSQDSSGLEEPQTANFSEINSYTSTASRLVFVEDFTLEHSLPGLRISPVEISSCF